MRKPWLTFSTESAGSGFSPKGCYLGKQRENFLPQSFFNSSIYWAARQAVR